MMSRKKMCVGNRNDRLKNVDTQYTCGINMADINTTPNNNSSTKTNTNDEQLIKELVNDVNRLFFLTVLYQGPIHGYGIIDQYKTKFDRVIGEAMVYPFLKMLVRKGYATVMVVQIGTKERKDYTLTASGQSFCKALFARFRDVYAVAIESV